MHEGVVNVSENSAVAIEPTVPKVTESVGLSADNDLPVFKLDGDEENIVQGITTGVVAFRGGSQTRYFISARQNRSWGNADGGLWRRKSRYG